MSWNFIDKISGLLKGNKSGAEPGNLPGLDQQRIKVLGGIALVGVGLIVAGNWLTNEAKTVSVSLPVVNSPVIGNEGSENTPSNLVQTETQIEEKLGRVLSQIQGAGDVDVSVSLAEGNRYDYAVNTVSTEKDTQEKDQQGGNRTTKETDSNSQLVLRKDPKSGQESPVIINEYRPKVQGVLVVSSGATKPVVKARLIKAVQTVCDVPPHKISVLTRKGGE